MKLTSYNKHKIDFYKGKYAIAFYDEDDYLFDILDNVQDIAIKYKVSYNVIASSLSHKVERLRINNKLYKYYLIDMKENTDER